MANSKISDLTELTSAANADVLVIVDDSASETKKISFQNLSSSISVGTAGDVTLTVLNDTGSTIALGKAVYISGASGSDTTIALADNSAASTMPAVGITKESIANNATGAVTISGSLAGVNMSAFSEGDVLYVGTSGDLTDTKPTGTALIQNMGKVAKAAASGSFIVTGAGRSNDVPNLPENYIWYGDSNGVADPKELIGGTNVTITAAAGSVTIDAAGAGGASDLDDLTDVTITGTPAAGELLINNATSGDFVNATLTGGTGVTVTNADGSVTLAIGQAVGTTDDVTFGTITADITGTVDGTELEFLTRDGAIGTAGQAEGTIVKFGTGTLVAGQVYTHASGAWVAVDADAQATTEGLLGMALGTSPTTNGLLVHGVGYLSHDPGAAGDVLYVHTTAGELSSTQPSATGDFVRVAGYCLADNKVFFSPSQDFIEIG